MPPLVDANTSSQAPPNGIPPPPGATVMTNGPAPGMVPTSTMQYPWGTPFPGYVSHIFQICCSASSYKHSSYPFPSPQDQFGAWRWNYDTAVYPQQSGPSPYIPRQPLHQEMQSHSFAHVRGAHSLSNPLPGSHKRSMSLHKHSPWPSHGNLSPLDLPTRMPDIPIKMPDVHQFVPRAPDMHTPSSTLSRSFSTSAHIPPGMYHERPQQWRHDFKFKSGFASMLRSWSNPIRSLDGRSSFP